MSDCKPIFPATAYTGDDPIATEFAKLYRPQSTDYKTGMYATDLILLNRTPSYTEPKKTMDFLESNSLGLGVPIESWGPTDESIIEELAIAAFMVPEILHDKDYNWSQLYDMTEGVPFHTTQGERDLREQVSKLHFIPYSDAENIDTGEGGWILVSSEGTRDQELSQGERDNEEWNECQELSYFAEYDQSTDQEFFIVDNKGHPALHNAERHEQRCALNSLWNHPELDLKVEGTIMSLDGRGFNLSQKVVEKTNVLDECGIHSVECQLIATGNNFAAAICRYGGIFVPKRFQALIGDKGTFTARLTISTEGAKYPLRVTEINRC